ncbi:hypothetical protein [uncultured Roseovarius sp.]|uniref:hypothetical protein n=1 Tax=uncultured Roseovarius sp. TaxID=293344 RepID=UPI002631384A|nr:hypothetical protein [uncultured Roseovarius sp.]
MKGLTTRLRPSGLARVARRCLKPLVVAASRNTRLLQTVARVADLLGAADRAARLRAVRLRHLAPQYFETRDLSGVLGLMAEMERTGLAMQFSAGRLLADELVTASGRARLLDAAREIRETSPDSAFVSHVAALCQAMEEDHIAAGQALIAEMNDPPKAAKWLRARRFRLLEQSWRIVDLIARERMDWADEAGGYDALAISPPQTSRLGPLEGGERVQSFKEHALQGRMRDTYLDICIAEFNRADSLPARLAAIEAMVRTSIRHSPDYSASHACAARHLDGLDSEIATLFRPPPDKAAAEAQVLTLCTLLLLARRLDRPALAARIIARVEALSQDPLFLPVLWPVPAALARDPACLAHAERVMSRIRHQPPRINRDVQNFFRWAQLAQDDAGAEAFFAALSETMRRRAGCLYYVNILQRQGRFEEARALLRDIHGQALANPSKVNAVTSHGMIKRAGELDFLIETARIWQSVPQPTDVQGLVVIPARNIDALRRYPLMVLLELKRRGWAVIPLVQGLLPFQPTGRPEIDLMAGALTPNQHLTAAAEAAFPALTGFVADPAQGRLLWNELDFSHAVWEDAAINRRRYDICYDCPELQSYLGMLMGWTELLARALHYAHDLERAGGPPVMHMSLFNARLPDAIYAAYGRAHGDPERFFHVHVANGYQNYFTNFSTNMSHRFVLRNTTRARETRSASFPRPANFDRYLAEAQPELPQIRARFANTTQVRRSTGEAEPRPPEAEAALARIRDWKSRGGHVACAFGKVVCDSAVPFDGGPVHRSMKDWINHCIRAVEGSDTLLLIKPHPHELNNQIATFLTQYFTDLFDTPLGDNVLVLEHRWFDIHDLEDIVDLGLIYNGTTAVEMGLLGIPCLLSGHFAPIDYPIGHPVVETAEDFEAALRFERPVEAAPDLADRAAIWLDYMASETFTLPYRYHARPVTNTVMYPPWWVAEDLERYRKTGDPAVQTLTDRALGVGGEPGERP